MVVLALLQSWRVLGGDCFLVNTAALKELNRLRAGPSFPASFSCSGAVTLRFGSFESLLVLGEVLGNIQLANPLFGKRSLGDTKGIAFK